ncbi:MAG: hypothetical protein IPJ11_01160 [Gemmatimonadetes bacterium]|nr:hypothetical protein [Gemmatimonadota bacterium]
MRRLWLVMGLSLAACGGGSDPVVPPPPPPPPPAAVATVVVTAANASLQPPQTTTLTATLKDADGTVLTGRSITWSSRPRRRLVARRLRHRGDDRDQ